MNTLETLREQAAEGMRGYLANEGPDRTRATRQTAKALAEARRHFFTREGEPDLLGRSYEYRQWVKSALDEADVPPNARPSLQSAVRFHISPLIREQLGVEDVEALGLQPGSTVERGGERRKRDARTLALFRGGSPITDSDDVMLVATLSRLAVERTAGSSTMSMEDASAAAGVFVALAKAAYAAAARLASGGA